MSPVPTDHGTPNTGRGAEGHEAGIAAYRESLASGHSEEHAVIAAIRATRTSQNEHEAGIEAAWESFDRTEHIDDVRKAIAAYLSATRGDHGSA